MLAELHALARTTALAPIEVVDVDSDPVLQRRHGLDVPVLLLDGSVVCRHRLDAAELKRLLTVAPARSVGFAFILRSSPQDPSKMLHKILPVDRSAPLELAAAAPPPPLPTRTSPSPFTPTISPWCRTIAPSSSPAANNAWSSRTSRRRSAPRRSRSPPKSLTIVEQNFDFDLLTPAKLMEKAVGHEVTLVRTNPGTGEETREKALVLATNGGVVLKIGDHIEVLRDDGMPARVIFDKVPDNLRAHPTLSVTVNGAHSGPVPATLSYLTPGLGWRADYVALFDEASREDRRARLDHADQLERHDLRQCQDAAGRRVPQHRAAIRTAAVDSTCGSPRPTLQQAGTESGSRERLGDYYLYPLAERTTIANLQTKQVSFLDVHGVPAEHGYEFRNALAGDFRTRRRARRPSTDSPPARTPASAINCPPESCGSTCATSAVIRSSSARAGSTTPRWAPMLSLATGDAFDVKVQPTVEKRTRLGMFHWQSDMRYVLSNALPTPSRSRCCSRVCGANAIKARVRKARAVMRRRPSGWSLSRPTAP